jgi:heat shock protein HslJ
MKLIVTGCLFLLLACQEPSDRHLNQDTLVSATASPGIPEPPDSTTLAGMWFLMPVLPSDTATGRIPTLRLELAKTHFSGNTGCNTMSGGFYFSDRDSSLSFSDKIITTRMACQGYNEQAFLKSLRQTGHYRLRNGVLTLLSDDHAELSRWIRKPAVPPKSLKA